MCGETLKTLLPVLSGLVGVLLGTVGALLGTWLTDKRTERREIRAFRVKAYSNFLAEIAKAEHTKWPAISIPTPTSEALWRAKMRVALLSGDSVNVAATAVVRLLEATPGADSEGQLSSLMTSLHKALTKSLGIKDAT